MSDNKLPDLFNPFGSPDHSKRPLFGALSRTMERLKERGAALAQAREEAALALIERRFTPHLCAVSGVRWREEWRKGAGDALFRLYVDDFSTACGGTPKATNEAVCDLGAFPVGDFSWSDLWCRGCGDTRLRMMCGCGVIVCGGRTVFRPGEVPFFHCHASCGKSFPGGTPATVAPGQSAAREKHAALAASAPVAGALSKPGNALLLPGPSTTKR